MILLLDDDDTFRSALAETLRDDGYEVADYAEPSQLPPLGTFDRVTNVIADWQMPTSDGITFADKFHAVHRDVPVIVITAYSTDGLEAQVAARPFVQLLPKPVDYGTLLSLLS